jgi:hypothetical protein
MIPEKLKLVKNGDELLINMKQNRIGSAVRTALKRIKGS